MTTEQLAALKELAEAARTGDKPWREGTANVWDETTDECIAVTYRNQLSRSKQLAIARFIAAFDPATCKELVEEVERLTGENDRMNEMMLALCQSQERSAKQQ